MRPPRDEDAAWIAELFSRCAPEPVTVETILREWESPTLDPERDVRVDDRSAALVDVEGDRAWLDVVGSPSPQLLDWAEARARDGGAVRLLAGAWEGSEALPALDAAGFRWQGSSVRMRIDLVPAPPPASFPDGVDVRTFRAGDDRTVYELHFDTFADLSEPMRAGYDEWAHYMLAPPEFEPESWFLAFAGDTPVGLALCHVHPTVEAGEIATLGVRRPWRGRGLGRALLLHAFAHFAARGLPAAILGVQEQSLTGADRLYESAGMRVTHRRIRYEKELA